MSNPSTRVTTTVNEPEVDTRKSAFARVFNRNGHEKVKEPETIPVGPPKSIWREYFESAVVTVIMALFGMTFIVQAVKVPTGSMQNTIPFGDLLFLKNFFFAQEKPFPSLPQREIRRGESRAVAG